MRRQNTFSGDQDSDQSISDEEDFNVDLRDNCVSLGGHSEKEEGRQLQSRLEAVKGTHGVNCRMITDNASPQQTSISLEDEVEMPDFADEVGVVFSARKASTCNSEEKVISDDEKGGIHDFGSGKLDGENTWSVVSKEAEALSRLNKNALCSSSSHSAYKVNKSGFHSKSKPKFSFCFQSQRGELSLPSISKVENGVPYKVHGVPERLGMVDCEKYSMAELPEEFPGIKPKQSESLSDKVEDLHQYGKQSMAELLDGLQDNTTLLRRNLKYSKPRGKRIQVDVKRSISPLGDRTLNSKDLPEHAGSISSSDDEDHNQNLELAAPEMKRQTIVDRFQEALGATLRDEAAFFALPRASGVGLFGKLQQVMQVEKYTDMDFLKLQTSTSPNDAPCCINVKILSRYLDAKLIVCHVSIGKDTEDCQWSENNQKMTNGGRERTIIFNPRVCCDVDLDVGNSILIHPPWKEVQVRGNDESIILSTYYSQIAT